MLFDGKLSHSSQIERVRECEKLLVAIDLAAWLNDGQLIMQAIIQCYGLLAPLIYFNVAHESICQVKTFISWFCLFIWMNLSFSCNKMFKKLRKEIFDFTKVLSHCLIVLEELPHATFQRKPKGVFDSLQHMIACSTFYLTDALKRFNKRPLAQYFNAIGRKLLGMDESLGNGKPGFSLFYKMAQIK